MSRLSPIRPDPMPLREALRGMRHVLRRGGETLRETMGVSMLPQPMADIAGAVLREVEQLARNVDSVASGIAKKVLVPETAPPPTLRGLTGGGGTAEEFAAGCYAALQAILPKLGVASAFVSEAAAGQAIEAWISAHPPGADARPSEEGAAQLMRGLLGARIIRDALHGERLAVPAAALEPVAVFALVLWLSADRSDAEAEAALEAATALALAVTEEIVAATEAPGTDRLAALVSEWAAHV